MVRKTDKPLRVYFVPYTLRFKQPAGTSRGILRSKQTYLLVIKQGKRYGIGECAIFKGLSADDRLGYRQALQETTVQLQRNLNFNKRKLRSWPSILFGVETALKSFHAERNDVLFPSGFTEGKKGIPINGLIWMGDKNFMLKQIREKIEAGFRVIKIKIGSLDFETELDILKFIRKNYSDKEIEIRLDANGAFNPGEALEKINRLAEYDIHSIEQPIRPRQWKKMAEICRQSPVPIALDEELIGLFSKKDKLNMMEIIRPQYLIFKPSLIGGFSGTDEWIKIARLFHTPWWITSALESNIGLNAIAQYTFEKKVQMPQGLGTGSLFTNNFHSPLYMRNDTLFFNPEEKLKICSEYL